MKKVKLAIVSDLHCHPKRDVEKEGVNCTYLFADILRNHDHPIENLINLLKSEEVDYILCPGDITDKCNTQGFIGGWNYLLELKEHFKAKKIIATVGNHDVDSRGNNDSYSYSNVKGIKKNYPFENNGDKIIEEFYANGYTIIEENEIIFLVIDSCFYHHNKEESPKGKILIDTINEIENKVKELDEEKYKILLLHHHPIEHTRKDLGEEDVLKNGKELVEMISNYNFDLIIHGHKHDPWLRLENNITILSSGSFSSTSNFQFTSDRNRFHIVELNEKSKGRIKTWTYLPYSGWSFKNDSHSDFPPICGFGQNDIESVKDKILSLIQNNQPKNWDELENEINSIKYLPKENLEHLINFLRNENFVIENSNDTNYPSKIVRL